MKKFVYTLRTSGEIDLEDDIEYSEGLLMSLLKEKMSEERIQNFDVEYVIKEI